MSAPFRFAFSLIFLFSGLASTIPCLSIDAVSCNESMFSHLKPTEPGYARIITESFERSAVTNCDCINCCVCIGSCCARAFVKVDLTFNVSESPQSHFVIQASSYPEASIEMPKEPPRLFAA